MVTKEVDIYLLRDAERGFIRAVQGDSGNEVLMHIKDVDLPAGTTARAYVEKPSGLAVYVTASVQDNDITFGITNQMLAEAGTSRCQVHLENDGEVLTTFYIHIFVEERLVDVFDEAVADGIAAIEAAAEAAAGSLIEFTDPNEDGNIIITLGATGATGAT